jgi:hypothetical protein
MTRFWLSLLAALALHCVTPSPARGNAAPRVADAVITGWRSADLPEPGPSCWLDRLRVYVAPDVAEYELNCPAKSWACYVRPFAIIHPDADDATAARLALHEAFHELTYCTLGTMDYEHADKRVWFPIEGSAEDIARAILD